jgi:Resolvase, N terminal domain
VKTKTHFAFRVDIWDDAGNSMVEHVAGADDFEDAKTNRAELAKLIRRRLDRLARSTRDLLNVLATVGEREAGFRSLKDTWADTTTPHGRLMLTVLGGLAEFEREFDPSPYWGRPQARYQRQEALQRLANGDAQADVARSFNVSQATISRLQA